MVLEHVSCLGRLVYLIYLTKRTFVAWTKVLFGIMEEKKSYLLWANQGYLGNSECSFELEKENIQDYTIMYRNQFRISNKGSKKIYYGDYFIPT